MFLVYDKEPHIVQLLRLFVHTNTHFSEFLRKKLSISQKIKQYPKISLAYNYFKRFGLCHFFMHFLNLEIQFKTRLDLKSEFIMCE